MRTNNFKTKLKAAVRILGILPFAAVAAFGQQTINLSVAPTSLTVADGSTVPMWGYFCGTGSGPAATCAALNPTATGWSPVVITVPSGQALTINLTNNLSFLSGANNIPTSMVIVGQLGGGLGNTTPVTSPAPDHQAAMANNTWFIANTGNQGVSPTQGPRVRTFGTEVMPGVAAATPCTGTPLGCAALTWNNLRPGTYLLESGTHPSIQVPMGLYGILVVTAAPTTTAGVETAAGTADPGGAY